MTIDEAIYELETNVCYATENIRQACIMAVEALEQQKTGKWIPVSERLPEEFQRVLVTIVNYNGDKVVRVAEYYNRGGIGVFRIKENYEKWEVGEEGLLAWMPLPKPYKKDCEAEDG